MKKAVAVALLLVLVLLIPAGPSFAGGGGFHGGGFHGGFHGRGVVVVGGCCWGWGWGWGWGWPGYWAPPVIVQPQVIVQPAPVLVDNSGQPAQPQESFWYFCPNTRAYYPSVQSCSENWVKVPPRTE